MKTIELMINGQKAQFTTKSVTIDGKEYFYSHMTRLDHSPVVHTYRFEYDDGDVKMLTYDKKDGKIMAAIFSQVHKMLEMKKAKAAKQPEAPAKAEVPTETAKAEVPAEIAKAEEPAKAEVQEEAKAETAETSDVMDEMIKATIAINKEREKKEAEKAAKKARKKAKKNGTPLPKEEIKEDGNEGISEEDQQIDPEKQARIKKSLIVFSTVLIVIIAVSIAYYFVFGTNSAPAVTNPNITESQQYEDVDQLIEDLQ